ncbi:MAG: alpha/beta hydrolase family protein [Bacteroidota bacterium]
MQHDEAVWDIEEKKLFKFTEETNRGAIPIPNSTFILVYSGEKYKPNYKYGDDYLDFTIIDYRTGKIISEIKKQPYDHFFTMVSPNGKFISYFKEKDWWVYDIKNDKHNNITSNFSVPLHDIQYDWSGIAAPYGNPGWTYNDEKLVIYDEFDIWLVSPDGNTKTKMTHGRESETEFRIYKEQKSRNNSITFFGFENKMFDFGKKLVLYAFNKKTKESGYFTFLQDQPLEKIVFKSSNLWGLRSAKNNNDNYIYIQENYHRPRQLNLIKDGKETTLYKSNPITKKLAWQEPELISYSCLGEELQGILYYPSNFNTHKKYPMITSIYERKSDGLNNYIKPGENNTGFNIRDYNQEGYFVLYPDIKYKVNDPGNSAAKCVAEAVSEALKNKFISRKNLGLQGHSFGGYQTSFILTKTDLFKTAIASGGYHDLVRLYFSLDEYHKTSSFWRFEWHQQRIEGGFYENKNDFLSNSTLQHADKIKTPLLIWAGKDDDIISWEQSLALHFGLNRLGKKNSLLIYEEEGHMILGDKNRKDIRSRTKSWFDYYLKGGKKPKWINH